MLYHVSLSVGKMGFSIVANELEKEGAFSLYGVCFMADISAAEIHRLQTALRRLLGSPELTVEVPPRKGMSVEIAVAGEVVGTVYRDEDEGEVSYAINMTVLEEDLPPA